jgi:Tannase and feruloyl esterase
VNSLRLYGMAAALCLLGASAVVDAQSPVTTCDAAGIGSVRLFGDGPPVTIESAATATAGSGATAVQYCLVKVLAPQAIHIWVGLPLSDMWNGRWQSLGGGGYAGTIAAPISAVLGGYAGATTDTGHVGGRPDLPVASLDGSFGMLAPGVPNKPLQIDFAWRSEHLMAVIGKQLVRAFYGRGPTYSYWNGCSTGGRQGLRMAQDFPGDYDGVLAGAPAIHWDRFQAGQIWYQVVQLRDNGGPIGGGNSATSRSKLSLATNKAVAACDALDGVVDGVLTDPRDCPYSASADATLTNASCTPSDPTCLTPTEASAIDKMWQGPVSCAWHDHDGQCRVRDVPSRVLFGMGNKRLWYPNERGTDLGGLGGVTPFPIATEQPKFWVYFDPNWDWRTLDYANYLRFFKDSVARVGPLMASDNPNLARFRNRGGKVILWHGFADPLIVPGGTIDYYDAITRRLGGGYQQTQMFARLFMAPGVGHCGGGDGPQPQGFFEALVSWVEKGSAPEQILAAKPVGGATQTRPLCPYPAFARWTGIGSTDDAANFVCRASFGRSLLDDDSEELDAGE